MDFSPREIPGFSPYKITAWGQVFSDIGVRKECCLGKNGYRRIFLNGKFLNVHSLVLTAFVGHRPSSKHIAAHNNGNKNDNKITNLRWTTYSGNLRDRVKHNPFTWKKSLTKTMVDTAVEMRRNGHSLRSIGRHLSVSHGIIRQVFLGISYTYWTGIKCSK